MSVINWLSEQFQILYGFTLFKTNIAVVVILNEVSFKKNNWKKKRRFKDIFSAL